MTSIVTTSKGVAMSEAGDIITAEKFRRAYTGSKFEKGSRIALISRTDKDEYRATHIGTIISNEYFHRNGRNGRRLTIGDIKRVSGECIKLGKIVSSVCEFLVKEGSDHYGTNNLPPD